MITAELFADLKDLYKENLMRFAEQNGGYFIEKVHPLTEEDIEKALVQGLGYEPTEKVDKAFINYHFYNFTINPQITEQSRGFVTTIEISPDISWETRKG